MRRQLVACLLVVCGLTASQGCSSGRGEPEDWIVHPDGYSISKGRPQRINLHVVIGTSDHLKKTSVIRETAQEVQVEVVAVGLNGASDDVGVLTTTDVVSTAPLGERAVVDASTGKKIPRVRK